MLPIFRATHATRSEFAIVQALGTPDVVPVDLSMADQLFFLQGWLGVKPHDYMLNPQVQLEAQLTFRRRFRGLGLLGPNIGLGVEVPSALGADLVPTRQSTVGHAGRGEFDDLRAYLKQYREPDLLFAGYLPLFYATYYHMYDVVGDQMGAPYGILGPVETAALLLGIPNFFVWAKTCPDLIHDLMNKITTFLIHLTETKIEVLGRLEDDRHSWPRTASATSRRPCSVSS